jgi:hypothetical protein
MKVHEASGTESLRFATELLQQKRRQASQRAATFEKNPTETSSAAAAAPRVHCNERARL